MSYHENITRGRGTETFANEPTGYDGMGAVSLSRSVPAARTFTATPVTKLSRVIPR